MPAAEDGVCAGAVPLVAFPRPGSPGVPPITGVVADPSDPASASVVPRGESDEAWPDPLLGVPLFSRESIRPADELCPVAEPPPSLPPADALAWDGVDADPLSPPSTLVRLNDAPSWGDPPGAPPEVWTALPPSVDVCGTAPLAVPPASGDVCGAVAVLVEPPPSEPL
jgi:hypothetical protein